MLLPPAFVYSTRLPVSVYGTGTMIAIAAFLDSVTMRLRYLDFAPPRLIIKTTDLPIVSYSALSPVFPFPGPLRLLCPHSSESL